MKSPQELVAAAKAKIRELAPQELDRELAAADILIDVREAQEYSAGHLAGAVHMARGMLEFKLAALPDMQSSERRIVLYCKTGGRSALAAVALQEMGYTNVISMAGGYDAWVAAGRPTE